ncbi:DUF3962 domain-containing protein [Nocardia sp. CDC159]|uniref:DUF3962 domain-containing protein n=1 Tax=Nocardia pulmonis TaxID=2951408 RepID=A0A9X2E5I9_9NOCA|nr:MULTISPECIES: DUF3962 domain-containing protein [Nocardia]MCM6774512.1 DUF3962 domain-containing protein [Nocardia pulmonis]MCM6787422.1 DUF3962 domain-containing protein [Nocardia sp. CDC159]
MQYNNIQPAAFVPTGDGEPYRIWCHTLTFPKQWHAPILEFYRHGMPEHRQAKIKQVPIQRLNSALRTVAPDLITVGINASFDNSEPWLYANAQYPVPILTRFIYAWLRDLQPDPKMNPMFRETVERLDLKSLQWGSEQVNLLEHAVSPGGTSLPADRLYRLLPEFLAERIAALPAYRHCGKELSFKRVAVDSRANGAELMSWPPIEYETKKIGTWHYSAVIRVSLKTVPFSETPRIHLSAGVRRWVKGKIYLPRKSGVSTYLLAKSPLVREGLVPQRFAVATLEYDRTGREEVWRQGGPEGLLSTISAIDNLPSPGVFRKEPEAWLNGRDGLTAAAAYHTRMGRHPIGAGLMPSERRRLTEWAAQALHPLFKPAPELERSSIKRQNPKRALRDKVSTPKKATEQQARDIAEINEGIAKSNALARRALTAEALPESSLVVYLLYQKEAMRDHLLAAAEKSLGLEGYCTNDGEDLRAWRAPDLSVRIHMRRIADLGGPLGDMKPPRRSDELNDAIGDRRTAVALFLNTLSDEVAESAHLVIAELDGEKTFEPRTSDPKFAIRLGCADVKIVSQFIRPHDPNTPDEKDDSQFRAAAAWGDGLRQVGVRFIPAHTLPADAIPEKLNQVAFWMVKRQSTERLRSSQFTPVAILIRPSQNCILGRTADMDQWVPYPELLTSLTGIVPAAEEKTVEAQTALTASFVQKTLYALRGQPTLVVTHAQNSRSRWPWLLNSGLVQDRIQLGNGAIQRLALQGKQLRIARISTGDRDETPQWWATSPSSDGGGISKGLWVSADAAGSVENRVFYSTTDKASTRSVAVEASKLTPRTNSTGGLEIKPTVNAWNPDLLEITMAGLQPGDDAEQWAMYLHQQRFSDDYRDGLKLPLIMHLAELTSHYALPHSDETDPESELPPDEDEAAAGTYDDGQAA